MTRSDAPGGGGKTFKRRKFHAKAGKSVDIETLTHALEEDSGVMEELKRYVMAGRPVDVVCGRGCGVRRDLAEPGEGAPPATVTT